MHDVVKCCGHIKVYRALCWSDMHDVVQCCGHIKVYRALSWST